MSEWHQTFVPGRTGLFTDVVLDAAAALVAILLVPLLLGYRRSGRSPGVNRRDVTPHRAGREAPPHAE